MKFYHSTDLEAAKKIDTPEEILPSEFNFVEYINYLKKINWTFDEESKVLPSKFSDEEGDEKSVYWLGSGVYCFNEYDLEIAKNYSKKHDCLICISSEDDPDIFNMDSSANRRLLYKVTCYKSILG